MTLICSVAFYNLAHDNSLYSKSCTLHIYNIILQAHWLADIWTGCCVLKLIRNPQQILSSLVSQTVLNYQ